MNDEALNARLRRTDPSLGASVHPIDGPEAAALMEQIMNTPLSPSDPPAKNPYAPSRKARWVFGIAAVALVAVGTAVIVIDNSGNDSDGKQATQVTYSLVASDPMAMCMRVDAYVPTPGQPAFKGTVLSVGDGTATLQVSKWYAGGDADQVVLNSPDTITPDPVLEGGVVFAVGDEFLVMVLDGQVVGCGVSGLVSPELEDLYDGWFPA